MKHSLPFFHSLKITEYAVSPKTINLSISSTQPTKTYKKNSFSARHSLNKLEIAVGLVFFSMVYLRMAGVNSQCMNFLDQKDCRKKGAAIMYRNKTKEVNIIIQWSPEIQKRLHTMANWSTRKFTILVVPYWSSTLTTSYICFGVTSWVQIFQNALTCS